MLRSVPVGVLVLFILPNAGLSQGLFAFQGATPAEGGFTRTAIVTPPVQATLREVPSLEGPYGNELPSLSELGNLDTDAAPSNPTSSGVSQTANAAPLTSLRPKMNPLRAPVREKRKVGRFIRRLVTIPLRQKPQASKQNNLPTGIPVP